MLRATFSGSAYVGVFASVLADAVLVRPNLEEERQAGIAAELEAEVVTTTIGGGATVGSLVAGNSHGVVVSGQATTGETERLTAALDRPVEPLPDTLNAAGNLVLANDAGAVIHPELSDAAEAVIAETLDVPVHRGTVGGVKTVGMTAEVTARGVLCHPQATDEELGVLEDVLNVPADLGTINYGSPLIGSGLIANEHGYVAGERTTGPELGRIEDALDLVG